MKLINKFLNALKTGKTKYGNNAEKFSGRAANEVGKAKASLKRAQFYERRGELEKALKEYLLTAASFSRNRHYSQALAVYKHILKQSPNFDKIALKIGEIYRKMGQTENAFSAYSRLLRLYNKQGKEEKAAEVMCLMAELSANQITVGKQTQSPADESHFSKQISENATSENAPQNITSGGESSRIAFDLEAELEKNPPPEMKP